MTIPIVPQAMPNMPRQSQYNFDLKPVDFVGQYQKGVSFAKELEKDKDNKELQEAARREAAMVKDARQVKYLIENNMDDQALQLLSDRAQILSQGGQDVSETMAIYDMLRSNDPEGRVKALASINSYLKRFSEIDSNAKVGRYRTEKVGNKIVWYDSATNDIVREMEIPESKKEKAELRKKVADANKAESEAELKMSLAETDEEKRASKIDMLTETLSVASNLLNHESLGQAVGTITTMLPTFREDTQDVINLAQRLESLLTVDNLKLMTGVLTDRDIKFLTRVGSGLNITDDGIKGSEKAVRERLTQIVDRIKTSLTSAESTNSKSVGKSTVKGKLTPEQYAEAKRRGFTDQQIKAIEADLKNG